MLGGVHSYKKQMPITLREYASRNHLSRSTETAEDTVKLDIRLLQLSLRIGEGSDSTTSADHPLLITSLLRIMEEAGADGNGPVTTTTSTPVTEDTRVGATLEAFKALEEFDTALLGGTSHTARWQTAPQNLPTETVIDLNRCALRQRTLDNTNKLPQRLVLLNTTELGAFNILANSIVQIMANKIDNHQVLSDFLTATSQHLLSNLASDVREFANCTLDGAKLADSSG